MFMYSTKRTVVWRALIILHQYVSQQRVGLDVNKVNYIAFSVHYGVHGVTFNSGGGQVSPVCALFYIVCRKEVCITTQPSALWGQSHNALLQGVRNRDPPWMMDSIWSVRHRRHVRDIHASRLPEPREERMETQLVDKSTLWNHLLKILPKILAYRFKINPLFTF